jgi:hypothetical protein
VYASLLYIPIYNVQVFYFHRYMTIADVFPSTYGDHRGCSLYFWPHGSSTSTRNLDHHVPTFITT